MSTATVDLATELRTVLRARLDALLEWLAERLPAEEELPQRAERDARVEAYHAEVAQSVGMPTLQDALAAGLVSGLRPPPARANEMELCVELSTYRRGPTVAALLQEIRAGASLLVDYNAQQLQQTTEALSCPLLAEVASGGQSWPAWPWLAPNFRGDGPPEAFACLSLRLLCRWAWLRSGDDTPENCLPRAEWSTVGHWPGLELGAALKWCDKRTPWTQIGYFYDALLSPQEQVQHGWGQPYSWAMGLVTALGLAAFHGAWLARPELSAWETMARLATGEKTGDPAEVHRLLAAEHAGQGEENEAARNALARELLAQLQAFHKAHMARPAPAGPDACRELDGRLWLDELAARFLEPIGEAGIALARAWRERSTGRWAAAFAPLLPGVDRPPLTALWHLWLPVEDAAGASRFARGLARCLWTRMQAERHKPAALVLPVHEAVVSLHRSGLGIDMEARAVIFGQSQCVLPLGPPVALDAPGLPVIDLAALGPLLSAGIQRMGSLTAQRLLRWEVVTGHRQALAGQIDARKIVVQGGWSALAEQIGERSNKAAAYLPGIVAVQACIPWKWPDGSSGNMLSYREWPHAPGRPAMLHLLLGDMLLPNAVMQIAGHSRTAQEARRLVPVVDLLPPMAGRAREQGPQAALQFAALAEMRRHARELAEHGSVRIPLARWAELAAHVGLPRAMLGEVLDAWTRDGAGGVPAFLTRPDPADPWRFGLAGAYDAALAFLVAAGRRELGGAKGGRARAAKRAANLEKGTPEGKWRKQ